MRYIKQPHRRWNWIGLIKIAIVGACIHVAYSSPAIAQTPCPTCPPLKPTHARPAPRPVPQPQVDWTTMGSTYTHDGAGQRVDQYAIPVEPESNVSPDFVRSGYSQSRSSLQVGFNSDHYHVTEQWGGGTRPYGEWRSPFRPFATPYGAWGPQLPQIVGGGFGFGVAGVGNPGIGSGQPGNGGGWNGPGIPGPGGPMGPGGVNPGPGLGFRRPEFPNGFPPGYATIPQGAPYGGVGAFGVGPANAVSPTQDDYYPQAPVYQQPSEGFFNSPYR